MSARSAARPRLLVVVAHPDDETFGCGSLLLHAAAAGYETRVVCATRGEAGQGDAAAVDLGRVREGELREAASRLGVTEVELLAYADSGMQGPAGPETLAGAPFDTVVEAVRAAVDRVRPSVLVTLDGSDGHRDHVRIRDASLAAVEQAAVPFAYLSCLPRSLMAEWFAHAAVDRPEREHLELDLDVPGTPDEDLTTLVPAHEHLSALEHAMRAHASQDSPYDGLPGDLRERFLATARLRRVVPPWDGSPSETRLPAH